MHIAVHVNGEETVADVEPRLLLVHYLRQTLGLTGRGRSWHTQHWITGSQVPRRRRLWSSSVRISLS
jgi:hypothetical protein